MAKNTMNKKINNIAKKAKNNHAATIAVIAGAGLSVLGNATIGVMTVVKAVKNKKAAKAVDDEKKDASKKDDSNNNPPTGGENNNDNNQQNPENK